MMKRKPQYRIVRQPLEDMSSDQSKVYETSELGLATALSLRFPILRIDRFDPKRGIFIFGWDERLPILEERFWQGDLKVDAKSYYSHLRDLKTRLLRSEF